MTNCKHGNGPECHQCRKALDLCNQEIEWAEKNLKNHIFGDSPISMSALSSYRTAFKKILKYYSNETKCGATCRHEYEKKDKP